MDEQGRMFRLAHEAVVVQAHFRRGEGWHVVVQMRRGDETWEQARSGVYSHLSTVELVTAIESELEHGLDV